MEASPRFGTARQASKSQDTNPSSNYLPQQMKEFVPSDSEIFKCEGDHKIRMIFSGGILGRNNNVHEFKQYMLNNGLELSQEVPDCEILRHLQANHFSLKKTYFSLLQYTEWRRSSLPQKLTKLSKTLIKSGFMYVHGRDKCYRPCIVINPSALLPFQHLDPQILGKEVLKCCTFIIEFVIKHLLIPGKVENYVIICDLNKLKLSQIPKATVCNVVNFLTKNYRFRTWRIFVLRTTFCMKSGWKVLEKFMGEHTRSKLLLTDKSTDPQIFTLFHKSQVEEKYGGNAKNVTVHWPPTMPSDEYRLDQNDEQAEVNAAKNGNIENYEDLELGKFATFSERVSSIIDLQLNSRKYTQQELRIENSFESVAFPRSAGIKNPPKTHALSQLDAEESENVETDDAMTSTSSISLSTFEVNQATIEIFPQEEISTPLEPKTCEEEELDFPEIEEEAALETRKNTFVIENGRKVYQWDFE